MNFRQLPHLPYAKIFILVFSCFGAESEFLEKSSSYTEIFLVIYKGVDKQHIFPANEPVDFAYLEKLHW